MLTFLFWNLNRKNLAASIARLVDAHSVDVLILAEATAPLVLPAALLPLLNQNAHDAPFYYAPDFCPRIEIFVRRPYDLATPLFEDSHFTIRPLRLPGGGDILLAAAHLESKLQDSDKSQYDEMFKFADAVRRAEDELGHMRTIVVGDLNMNPFEYGVISAMRLHGVSSKAIARQKSRTIKGREYPYFYNPMWRCFGDRPDSPPGTYYYWKATHELYFWNVFDQVLVRPALLGAWDDRYLEILRGDGEMSFLSAQGFPGGKNRSDHLPLLFRLSL